jgi:NADPH2:quinone reductase
MNRFIEFTETGGPEVLRLRDEDVPVPGPGQVLVEHTAVGVNMIECYQRSGLYQVPLPSRLGTEAAGVVRALGPGVEGLAVGQRVAYATGRLGAYARFALQPVGALVPVPAGLADEVAAAALLKAMTVDLLIHDVFAVREGTSVLLHAAAGGVGLLACQWLRSKGATVIGVVSNDAKAELARAHGATYTVVTPREDFVGRVMELTNGHGVDVAYDSVGRDTLLKSLACLALRGHLVGFGNASGRPEPFDMMLLARGSLSLTRPSLFHFVAQRDELLRRAARVFEHIEGGVLHVPIGLRAPLSEVAEVHRALESRRTTGSTVLIP